MIKMRETWMQPETVVLHLSGELLTFEEHDYFLNEIKNLMWKGARQVLVDLKKVAHINSSGLGALIAGLTSLRRAGGDLMLACLNEHVYHIFEMTKLLNIFRIFPSVDDGIAALTRIEEEKV